MATFNVNVNAWRSSEMTPRPRTLHESSATIARHRHMTGKLRMLSNCLMHRASTSSSCSSRCPRPSSLCNDSDESSSEDDDSTNNNSSSKLKTPGYHDNDVTHSMCNAHYAMYAAHDAKLLLLGEGSHRTQHHWRRDTVATESSVLLLTDVLAQIKVKAACGSGGAWSRSQYGGWERWQHASTTRDPPTSHTVKRSGLSASEIQSPDSNDSGIGLQADDNSQPDDNGNYA